MHPLSVGLDEAGRGCVIGPLVVAIVAATPRDRRWFTDRNVRDSKIVPAKERDELAERIRARCWHRIVLAEPIEIDETISDPARSLTDLEMEMMMALLHAFQDAHEEYDARIIIDAMSVNAGDICNRFRAGGRTIAKHQINAWHHADSTDRTVAAASIIAKSERERLIHSIRCRIGCDFGSGYSSDPKTQAFIQNCAPDCPHVRWKWKTCQKLRTA